MNSKKNKKKRMPSNNMETRNLEAMRDVYLTEGRWMDRTELFWQLKSKIHRCVCTHHPPLCL